MTGETHFLDKGISGNPLILGEYSEPEFANVRRWLVDEKIDGTNIRIFIKKFEAKISATFGGRSANAVIPPGLYAHLEQTFTSERIEKAFDGEELEAVLFGEGVGPKIQSGGYYSKTPKFVLFDVLIGHWWLKRDGVTEIADRLQIPVVPDFGVLTEEQIMELVKSKPLSKFAQVEPHMIEGVVCRADPLMLYRTGKPLMWKLKCRDFI